MSLCQSQFLSPFFPDQADCFMCSAFRLGIEGLVMFKRDTQFDAGVLYTLLIGKVVLAR